MFPGVVRPFGVVKLGPDCYTGSDAYSGYLPTGVVQGFSMMHESGTGGAPKYGVVAQLPVVGNISNPLSDYSVERSADDQASVGYYKSDLANGVSVELAATSHAGLLSYQFPAANASSSNNVLVDVSHVLPSFRGQGLGQNYEFGNISIAEDGHYEGSGVYNNGWNRGKTVRHDDILRKLMFVSVQRRTGRSTSVADSTRRRPASKYSLATAPRSIRMETALRRRATIVSVRYTHLSTRTSSPTLASHGYLPRRHASTSTQSCLRARPSMMLSAIRRQSGTTTY